MIMNNTWKIALAIGIMVVMLTGCGTQKETQKSAVKVNAYKVTAENTPVTAEYSGSVSALNKVSVQARVSGRIVEKYVSGGQSVEEGQPLYRIDGRQYESALSNAQATQAQSEANLANQQLMLKRYQMLASEDAIAQETYDTQQSVTRQNESLVAANAAQVQIAQDNVDDTIVRAPFAGKLSVDDLPIGTYVTAGNTSLVTISTSNPVYVEFSVSEAEYLKLAKKNAATGSNWGDNLKMRLSDGTIYGETGKIVQINQGMTGASGSLVIKALFSNPDGILIPGLYATIVSDTQIQKDAIVVPQRAVQQTLGRYFVSIINGDGKAVQKQVTPGQVVGKFWVINDGLAVDDAIIVDGYQKANGAASLDITYLTKDDINNANSDSKSDSTQK